MRWGKLRSMARAGAAGAGGPPEAAPAVEPGPQIAPAPEPPEFARDFPIGQLESNGLLATTRIYERLEPAQIEHVERLIAAQPELAPAYDALPPGPQRHRILLAYGMWLDPAMVGSAAGLPAGQPPEGIHAMARGPLSASGGLYEADMVLDGLASCGVESGELRTALDFGCSSGRVVRVLASALPEVRWSGCDPNAAAIEWAGANLPAIDFFQSPNAPPLPRAEGSFDLVCAISIWSHFAVQLGSAWLREMHRLIRPGGWLVLTTHGLASIAHYHATGERPAEQLQEIRAALYQRGWWYAAEFGETGDWGVVDSEWGTAYLTPEWLLSEACPQWCVQEFAAGRNQDNQDLYVLQRV